jgi:hypothetical protein
MNVVTDYLKLLHCSIPVGTTSEAVMRYSTHVYFRTQPNFFPEFQGSLNAHIKHSPSILVTNIMRQEGATMGLAGPKADALKTSAWILPTCSIVTLYTKDPVR